MCGIFGVFNVKKAAELTCIGLHAIQHRAIDYAGMVTSDGFNFYRHSGPDIARRVFTPAVLERLHGKDALGHIRYPTVTDDSRRDNTQPIVLNYTAIAHNGNLTNVEQLKEMFAGVRAATSMDTEYILRLLAAEKGSDVLENLERALVPVRGSYALGILLRDRLIAVNDPSSCRPLVVGELDGGYCISSETCALQTIGAHNIREIEAGTIVSISKQGIEVRKMTSLVKTPLAHCRFESIYFSHPASVVFGDGVADFRKRLGAKLEELYPVPDADIVVPVPDSAIFMAEGYAQSGRSGRYTLAITRSHYVGRSFIAANQGLRDLAVKLKFTAIESQIRDKRIVLIDDSIVRFTTLPKIVKLLRDAGAREVHVRIGCPPIRHPCKYGINTPSYNELAAHTMTESDMLERSGAHSLKFLPFEALRGLSDRPDEYCYACITGEYPLPV